MTALLTSVLTLALAGLGTTAQAADAGHGSGRMGPVNARTTTVNPAAGPDFELPFLCGQSWTGSSRSSHSPSAYTVDFNAPDDYRKPVVASARGVVTLTRSLTYSYGRYIVIDHGSGYTTLYAHLDSIATTVGSVVEQGDLIGYLGTTGGSTGPHLHFEERKDGAYFPPYFHRSTFRFGSTVSSLNCTDRPVAGDWNGDGRAEVGIARTAATGTSFYQRGTGTVAWGAANDRPAVGDYDGDRTDQIGVRARGYSTWYLRSRTGANAAVTGVGASSDIPVVGDWDGNGRDNLGYYRSSTRTFYLRGEDGSYRTVALGSAGDRPVVGDWNGDRITDLGVYRAGTFWLRVPSGSSFTLQKFAYGSTGDLPVSGDWNGDGRTDVGVWWPRNATFYLREAALGVAEGTTTKVVWGLPQG